MFIEMQISGLSMDPFTNMPFLVLKDKEDKHRIPIWIGLFEASAIATELERIKLKRPMTHDLMRVIIDKSDLELQHVEIYDLIESTFYAKMVFHKTASTEKIEIDCRPSDAIAVAIREKVTILVEERVVEKARDIDLSTAAAGEKEKVSKEKWKEILENLSPEDFGKYKM